MKPQYVDHDSNIDRLSWPDAVAALRSGHGLPRAEVADLLLGPASACLLNRAAFIEGLGYGVKAVTVTQANQARNLPTVQGGMMVYSADTGALRALIDSRLITEIKTAADSLLGTTLLARTDSKRVLIVGAGVVADSLLRGYPQVFPGLEEIAIWARRPEQAVALAECYQQLDLKVHAVSDLADAVARADIVSTATMATTPILRGEWVSAGTHVDLIGAFRPDMREADDALISAGSLFVDSRETTLEHIGELRIPLAEGVIRSSDVKADFYELVAGNHPGRSSGDEITVFKNGGGAHLDLMIADYILTTLADA